MFFEPFFPLFCPHQDRCQRQVQRFQLKATQLEDAVADHTMSEERRRKSLNVAWRVEEVIGSMKLLCFWPLKSTMGTPDS